MKLSTALSDRVVLLTLFMAYRGEFGVRQGSKDGAGIEAESRFKRGSMTGPKPGDGLSGGGGGT